MKKCILCGEDLEQEPTNLEHYVPAVAIRNFDKLLVPRRFDTALRENYCGEETERCLAPISAHRRWATVRVHTRCNTDAAPMCEDLKYIIDHIDEKIPHHKYRRIIEYYAYLWKVDVQDITIERFNKDETKQRFEGAEVFQMYAEGYLDLCHLVIYAESLLGADNEPGVEKHWIWIGTSRALV